MIYAVAMMVAVTCAALVCWRATGVLNDQNIRSRVHGYPRWLAFGLSYSILMIAAIGSVVHIWQGHATTGDWLWLIAAGGLVVFDRRHNRSS